MFSARATNSDILFSTIWVSWHLTSSQVYYQKMAFASLRLIIFAELIFIKFLKMSSPLPRKGQGKAFFKWELFCISGTQKVRMKSFGHPRCGHSLYLKFPFYLFYLISWLNWSYLKWKLSSCMENFYMVKLNDGKEKAPVFLLTYHKVQEIIRKIF